MNKELTRASLYYGNCVARYHQAMRLNDGSPRAQGRIDAAYDEMVLAHNKLSFVAESVEHANEQSPCA